MNGVLKLKTVNYVEILFMVISIISLGISAVSIFWTIKTKNRSITFFAFFLICNH